MIHKWFFKFQGNKYGSLIHNTEFNTEYLIQNFVSDKLTVTRNALCPFQGKKYCETEVFDSLLNNSLNNSSIKM